MTRHKPKILFLSTGNATRSLIAEGCLRTLTGDRFDVVSVGVEAGPSSPLAGEVMKEIGIDISAQKPKSVAQSLKEPFGHVITICDTAKERNPVFPFSLNVLHWSVSDPNTAAGLPEREAEVLRRVRDEIRGKVEQFVADNQQIKSSELSIA
ncbi:MAG: arsenate reductase ArsC [Candidatus Acidiferrum sp.]